MPPILLIVHYESIDQLKSGSIAWLIQRHYTETVG